MFKQEFLSRIKEIQRWQADQKHWCHCKMEANLSTSLFSTIHISTLPIHLELTRGISLCTLYLFINPTWRPDCQDIINHPWLDSLALYNCVHPLCGSIFHIFSIPEAPLTISLLELMVSNHKNSPDSIFWMLPLHWCSIEIGLSLENALASNIIKHEIFLICTSWPKVFFNAKWHWQVILPSSSPAIPLTVSTISSGSGHLFVEVVCRCIGLSPHPPKSGMMSFWILPMIAGV